MLCCDVLYNTPGDSGYRSVSDSYPVLDFCAARVQRKSELRRLILQSFHFGRTCARVTFHSEDGRRAEAQESGYVQKC